MDHNFISRFSLRTKLIAGASGLVLAAGSIGFFLGEARKPKPEPVIVGQIIPIQPFAYLQSYTDAFMWALPPEKRREWIQSARITDMFAMEPSGKPGHDAGWCMLMSPNKREALAYYKTPDQVGLPCISLKDSMVTFFTDDRNKGSRAVPKTPDYSGVSRL